MNLVIDIGNTRIKTAVFERNEMKDHQAGHHTREGQFISFIEAHGPYAHCILSSVTDIPAWLMNTIHRQEINPVILGQTTPLPFINNYQSKETLGKDRIAAIAGASFLYPGRNVLIIDAGTAITYDIKTDLEEFPGGNISPGMTMRFESLHRYTSRLPLLQPETTPEYIGRNTKEAILNGVQHGILAEIHDTIEEVNNKYHDLIVILTGGDAHFFENKLKKTIFVVSNLTLLGLNIILEHNAKIH